MMQGRVWSSVPEEVLNFGFDIGPLIDWKIDDFDLYLYYLPFFLKFSARNIDSIQRDIFIRQMCPSVGNPLHVYIHPDTLKLYEPSELMELRRNEVSQTLQKDVDFCGKLISKLSEKQRSCVAEFLDFFIETDEAFDDQREPFSNLWAKYLSP
ncbi:MAG: hypothetical protein NT027_07900 [Proteobacteria bacterium]|nr:hypothetical protein [Pseudomonadota bacterium]